MKKNINDKLKWFAVITTSYSEYKIYVKTLDITVRHFIVNRLKDCNGKKFEGFIELECKPKNSQEIIDIIKLRKV